MDQRHVVLVVEDEVLIRLGISEYLREHGFSVIEAATADEACSVLAAGVGVDLVFADVDVPGEMDGIALAEWMQTARRDVPVVLTSGVPGAAARTSHIRHFLHKPYEYEALVRRFRMLLAPDKA